MKIYIYSVETRQNRFNNQMKKGNKLSEKKIKNQIQCNFGGSNSKGLSKCVRVIRSSGH